jgi:hypothetical protein
MPIERADSDRHHEKNVAVGAATFFAIVTGSLALMASEI